MALLVSFIIYNNVLFLEFIETENIVSQITQELGDMTLHDTEQKTVFAAVS